MPQVIERLAYQYDELDPKVQERVIEDFGRQATEHDWWEHVTESSTDFLVLLGFADVDIAFSGFWSQGDGASFTGYWNSEFVKIDEARAEFLNPDDENSKIKPLIDELVSIMSTARLVDFELPTFEMVRRNNHYVHEQTIYYEFNNSEDCHEHQVELAEELEEKLKAWCIDLMRWIYRCLETEYDYQTSEEAIKETIEANEYLFDADGNLV